MHRRICIRGRVRVTLEGEKYAYLGHLVPCIRPCFVRLRISIRGRVRRSVCPSVRPVLFVLFSIGEKRHFPCSDDYEISHGERESRRQCENEIKMIKI